MQRADIHLAVVGTGPLGLEAAAWAKHRGYHLTVFEKQAGVGGDWLSWGNPWSKLQSHRDGYLFSGPVAVPGEDTLPAYPSREQMLDYFGTYASVTGISSHIRFNCMVTGRSAVQENGKLKVFFREQGGEDESLEVTHVFAAPGRVNKRRQVHFAGEPSFRGVVAWGNGQDLQGCPFAGKSVVVAGHGSFAIENARHALECGAASVVMLARHDQVVMSRAAGFFVDRHVDRHVPATAVLHALRSVYSLIGYGEQELEQLFFSPSKVMFPTSDFYFLARTAGKLKVVLGTVARLTETSVVTSSGLSLPADIFVKCLGFTQDAEFDAAMRPDLKKGGRVADFHYSNTTSRMSRTSVFAASSGGFRHVSPCYGLICRAEGLPARDLAASSDLLRERVLGWQGVWSSTVRRATSHSERTLSPSRRASGPAMPSCWVLISSIHTA